jgi:hypothetical protein
MSSRQMRRFLDNLGAGGGGSADGRLSPQDAMAKFRERIERHNELVLVVLPDSRRALAGARRPSRVR